MFGLISHTFAKSSLITYCHVESSKKSKKESFAESYLINTCGFSREKAISASNYLKFETREKPDSVLSFLKSHGFTESQVFKVVKSNPLVLSCDPRNTLLPKIEFFKAIGFEIWEFAPILCAAPAIFKTSVENQLWPTIDFLRKYISCLERIKACIKRWPWIFFPASRALMEENVRLLRGLGVDESRISYYVSQNPRLFVKGTDYFRSIVAEVRGLGFQPSRMTFIVAIAVRSSLSKSTWEKKISIYKKWGLSEKEVLETFLKMPYFMSRSEGKISGLMEFLVNTLGFRSNVVLKYPVMLSLSLKRVIPRCLVYQVLWSKGLLSKDPKLLWKVLKRSEEKFLNDYVGFYEKEIPEISRLYELFSMVTQELLSSPQESLSSPQELSSSPQELLSSPQEALSSPQELLSSPQFQETLSSPQE